MVAGRSAGHAAQLACWCVGLAGLLVGMLTRLRLAAGLSGQQFAMCLALAAYLAASQPENEATGQQSVEKKGGETGNKAGFARSNEHGHVKPADGNDIHGVIMH